MPKVPREAIPILALVGGVIAMTAYQSTRVFRRDVLHRPHRFNEDAYPPPLIDNDKTRSQTEKTRSQQH
jgi:hypothetical protein